MEAVSLICKAIRKIKLILIYKEKQKKLYNVLKTYDHLLTTGCFSLLLLLDNEKISLLISGIVVAKK